MAADLLSRIKLQGPIPRHVAIIMDGNGRWARQRRLPRPLGHRAGMDAVREAVEGAVQAGVQVLTIFAFSEENWQRPAGEIAALMDLLREYIAREGERLKGEGVAVRVFGDLERLSPAARAAVDQVQAATAGGRQLALNVCLSYSSRAEIARAARLLAEDVLRGALRLEQIDEQAVADRLYTAGVPDPDLLIRTSGEQRISNFLLWQLAYTEIYLTPVLWPDFTRDTLWEAILDYQRRERRFGKVPVA
jgi:undecaprenyl diphosphate synthase